MKKPSFEAACISYIHDVQLLNRMFFRNKYGLKISRDFIVFEGHRYPLRLAHPSYKMKMRNLGLHVGFYFATGGPMR
jgi:hypothetical protein